MRVEDVLFRELAVDFGRSIRGELVDLEARLGSVHAVLQSSGSPVHLQHGG